MIEVLSKETKFCSFKEKWNSVIEIWDLFCGWLEKLETSAKVGPGHF